MSIPTIRRPAEVGWFFRWKNCDTRSLGRLGRVWLCALGVVLLVPSLGLANDVKVVGVTPGVSANVVIDGGPPITIDVGETIEGVKLLRADQESAVLSFHGVAKTVPLTAYGGAVEDVIASITLTAGPGGHFFTDGVVNGHSLRFVVDTGASWVTISRADARRIGLHYRDGTPVRSSTANGTINGWQVSLDSVRVGQVTVRGVQGFVADNDALSIGLLGMTFLSRFDMQRHGSTLVLRRRR